MLDRSSALATIRHFYEAESTCLAPGDGDFCVIAAPRTSSASCTNLLLYPTAESGGAQRASSDG